MSDRTVPLTPRFEVLGPFRAWRGGNELDLGQVQQQVVLATLLLCANGPLGLEKLMNAVWGPAPPACAVNLLQRHVSGLRRVLEPHRSSREPSRFLNWTGAGYVLTTSDGALDLHTFDREVERARAARAEGDLPAAARSFHAALRVWRGRVCEGMSSPLLDAERDRLEERRLDVVEERIEVDLALGGGSDAVGELRQLVADHPLRERLHGLLMLALYRSGRQADALSAFRQLSRLLRSELGIEPGNHVRRIHAQILSADPVLEPPRTAPSGVHVTGPEEPPPPAMHTIPQDIADFTGRDAELNQILSTADPDRAITVHTVVGMPGVGKTALVRHAAHKLAGRFPHGQLFVDLHGHTPGQAPVDPAAVLATLLDKTGMSPQHLPADLEGRAARWRDRVNGKKLLLILDGAASSAQIRPLLPGSKDCLVLVTSRRRLTDLEGSAPLRLATLPPKEAELLFYRLARRDPRGPEAEAVAEVVRLCGCLPMAISLLAGRLAAHDSWTVSHLVTEFVAAQDRIGELALGDLAIASAFDMSYQDLPSGRRRLFRRLGLHPGPEIDAYAAAALDAIPLSTARRELEALYTDHLLDEPAPGRYRLHDLLRDYARTLTTDKDSADSRRQATERLLDYYEHTARAADRHLTRLTRPTSPTCGEPPVAAPPLPDWGAALIWMHAERANLLACIDHATLNHQTSRSISLTAGMAAFLRQEGPWTQAAALHRRAAVTAHHLGDRLGQANALNDLGRVRYLSGNYAEAANSLHCALSLFESLGNHLGQANALNGLGRVRRLTGDYTEGTEFLRRALTLFEDRGDRLGQAGALNNLGRMQFITDNYIEAVRLLRRALTLFEGLGDRLGQANVLNGLGRVRCLTGNYAEAGEFLRRALALFDDLGDRLGQANALWALGRVRCLTGSYPEAAEFLRSALTLFEDLGDRLGQANALNGLGRVRSATGDYAEATDLLYRALALSQDLGSRHGQANTLNELGHVLHLAGEYEEAAQQLQHALTLFHDIGDRQGEAEALNNKGALLAERYEPGEALTAYRRALCLARQVDSPLDEARALEGAARCQAQIPECGETATADLRLAADIYRRLGAAEAKTIAVPLPT